MCLTEQRSSSKYIVWVSGDNAACFDLTIQKDTIITRARKMEVFTRPGSLTVYTSAQRQGLPPPNDCPPAVGPASYANIESSFKCRPETVAPFHTTAIRDHQLKPNGLPGPAEYFPDRRAHREYGTPSLSVGPRFRDDMYCNDESPGPIYKPEDAIDKLVYDTELLMTTKQRRVEAARFVSNNVPTVFNPRDMDQFVVGIDGRMYPCWKEKTKFDSPGPIYDVSKSRTSKNKRPAQVDFSHSKTCREIFKPQPGFGPADFYTRKSLANSGGTFLSKTGNPKFSIPRLFDVLLCRPNLSSSSPASYCPKSEFDRSCPKAVTAPFKSTAPRLAPGPNTNGPGPTTYFQEQKRMQDIQPPIPGYSFSDPPESPPFNTTAERFPNQSDFDSIPGPSDYYIYGFTDMMQYDLCRHPPAVCNPRLGFLTSAEARSKNGYLKGMDFFINTRPPTIPGKWRNMRPRRIRTAPFHGPQNGWDDGQTPAPNAYDTRSADKYVKEKKVCTSWNPRDYTGAGFGNSGCGRVLKLADIDYDTPGPKYAVRSEFPGPGGYVKSTGARFTDSTTESPGPKHKPHEKYDSIWRATQLGTPNVFLKGIDRICPTAGGFHPFGPLDALADQQREFCRPDEYDTVPAPVRPKSGGKSRTSLTECGSKEYMSQQPDPEQQQSEHELQDKVQVQVQGSIQDMEAEKQQEAEYEEEAGDEGANQEMLDVDLEAEVEQEHEDEYEYEEEEFEHDQVIKEETRDEEFEEEEREQLAIGGNMKLHASQLQSDADAATAAEE